MKSSFKKILFLFAGLLVAANPIYSAKKKKNKISKTCLNCLNSFSGETLNFPKNIRAKCTKILSSCDKTDRTGDCEKVINECFEYNCSAPGACSNATSNRALLFGCLSAENKFMPYQCRNYIKGKASSFAEQAKASAKQEELKQQAEIETAKVEAEKAKAASAQAAEEAKIKQAQIEAEAKTKQAQIEAENKIKLEEKKKQLELQAVRDQKKEKINSNPNVKYNKALNNVRKAITQAKKESNSIFAKMNINEITHEECNQYNNNTNPLIFAPKCVPISVITKDNFNSDDKMEMLIRNSRYSIKKETNTTNFVNFVCNKDIKESFVKSKLENIYNILTTANENLNNDITEIENSNFDETQTQFVPEEKFDILTNIQNNLGAALKQIQTHTNTLTTSCETRCKGIMTMNFKKRSSGIQFDEKGNIIEDKPDENSGYSCPDLQPTAAEKTENKTPSSPFDMNNMMSFMTGSTTNDKETPAQKEAREAKEKEMQDKSLKKMMGGMNYQAMEITERTTRAILEVDKTLDEINIIALTNKIIGIGSFSGGGSYTGSDFCPDYDKTKFAECMLPKFEELLQQRKLSTYNKEKLITQIESINKVFGSLKECKGITRETTEDMLYKCKTEAYAKLAEKAKKINNNQHSYNNYRTIPNFVCPDGKKLITPTNPYMQPYCE